MINIHLDVLKMKLNMCLKMYTWKSVCKFSEYLCQDNNIIASQSTRNFKAPNILPFWYLSKRCTGNLGSSMACQMEEPGRVVRIPKIYQDFCHYSLAEDFKIDQIRKTNERFFFKIFIKIDTKPNIKGEINLTNLDIHSLGIFQPVRVDV